MAIDVDYAVPEAAAYEHKNRELTPKEAVDEYEWDKGLVDRGFYEPRFVDFKKRRPDIPIDPKDVADKLEAANALGAKCYKMLNRGLVYHDDIHAEITAVVGTEMLIGRFAKLVEEPKFKQYSDRDPALMGDILKVATVAYALHEAEDWWNLAENASVLPSIKEEILKNLKDMGINPNDINRIIMLDIFSEPLPASITKAAGENLEKPFLPVPPDAPPSVLDRLPKDPEFIYAIYDALGGPMRSADFLQVINNRYKEPVALKDVNGQIINKNVPIGAVALAQEFLDLRPNALKFAKWDVYDEKGKIMIAWDKVDISEFYFDKVLMPNVNLGLEDLGRFDPRQKEEAVKRLQEVEQKFVRPKPQP